MSDKLRPVRPSPPFPPPRLQLTVMRRAESFVCRRCVAQGYVGAEEAFDAPYHFHPEIELLLMESSHGTRFVADSIETYAPGDLVLIGANVPHVFVREAGADHPSLSRDSRHVAAGVSPSRGGPTARPASARPGETIIAVAGSQHSVGGTAPADR